MNEENVSESCIKEFYFCYPYLTDPSKLNEISVPVEIPYLGLASELCANLVEKFNVPAYVEEELEEALDEFIRSESTRYLDEPAIEILESFENDELDTQQLIDKWEKCYIENTVEFGGDQFGSDDAELFSTVYHKLVHSPALETILQVENSYANTIHNIVSVRDTTLQQLQTKQTEEMQNAMDEVGLALTESQVTELAGRHLEEHAMQMARFASKLDSTQESQKREYREWLMSLVERTCDSPVRSPIQNSGCHGLYDARDGGYASDGGNMEESFTIYLGSQLKHMYNIRILCADPLDLIKLKSTLSGDLDGEQPQRLQTALSLFSTDLCGLVLLTDTYLGTFSGITKDFMSVCEKSTELHFSSVEKQLDGVRNSVKEGVEWRRVLSTSASDCNSLTSSEIQARRIGTKNLQTGDVYLTKHSNLSNVHVVFHMVIDDSVKSNDINSRHAAILGLRNIMKCACSNDISSLTVPLLLTHELTPEMNLNWCNKRAELVYKCVKGFMIEMASWGGAELKNLQFLVPKGLDEERFGSLATMIPSVFKLSNPLVLKGNTQDLTKPEKNTKDTDKKSDKIFSLSQKKKAK